MVNSLQAYDQIQILTQGGPSGSTRTLLYMYYQLGFEEYNMGQATAVAHRTGFWRSSNRRYRFMDIRTDRQQMSVTEKEERSI